MVIGKELFVCTLCWEFAILEEEKGVDFKRLPDGIRSKNSWRTSGVIWRTYICGSPQTGQIFFILLRRLSVLRKLTRLRLEQSFRRTLCSQNFENLSKFACESADTLPHIRRRWLLENFEYHRTDIAP